MKSNEFSINQQNLEKLRAAVKASLSPKRWNHTFEVEKMAARLAELYCPKKSDLLRVAALLHDITKEWPVEKHCAFCASHGIRLSPQNILAHKTLHARTAAALIPELFPAFAEPEILSAVRWHTTGRANMTLCEKLIYLADYIDASRAFPDCIALREAFWNANPQSMNSAARKDHLRNILLQSFDMTISGLLAEGLPIAPDTVAARNSLVLERAKKKV